MPSLKFWPEVREERELVRVTKKTRGRITRVLKTVRWKRHAMIEGLIIIGLGVVETEIKNGEYDAPLEGQS